MPSDESKGSQLDAIGSLAQRQLDNTVQNLASQLLWGCQTSRIRTSLSCSLRIHSADPDATQDQMRDLPAPVYVSWRACAGSRTTRGRNSSCDNDLLRVAFRAIRRRRPPEVYFTFAAQYPARTSPCQRFAFALANNNA